MRALGSIIESTRDTLGKIQAISVIFASIAVPILVAYFTWQSQKQINEQTLQKDYLKNSSTST